MDSWLRKRLWTCRMRDYGMNETTIDTRYLCVTTGVRLASQPYSPVTKYSFTKATNWDDVRRLQMRAISRKRRRKLCRSTIFKILFLTTANITHYEPFGAAVDRVHHDHRYAYNTHIHVIMCHHTCHRMSQSENYVFFGVIRLV